LDDEKRNALFAEAARIALEEETIIIFVYYPSSVYATRQGMTVAPFNDGRFLVHEIRKR
jgi:ABC-type transport system substrate-binding protein